MLLTEFRQRVRDVRQGPDGFVYLLTDENPGCAVEARTGAIEMHRDVKYNHEETMSAGRS